MRGEIPISKITTLLVNPNELPLELQIENTLEAIENKVGGPIEFVYIKDTMDNVCLIYNENARIYNFKPNRFLENSFIYGKFLIIGKATKLETFRSLTKKQIKYYKNFFGEESINKTNSRIVARKIATALFRRR